MKGGIESMKSKLKVGLVILVVGSLTLFGCKGKNDSTNINKEIYYWIAILFSNSLGTAFGDFLSNHVGLSYLNGAIVTGAIIIIVAM